MQIRTRGRDVSIRSSPEWGRSTDPAQWRSAGMPYSGVAVDRDRALGLPAAWAAIRIAAGTIASLPLKIYRDGEFGDEVVADSWQGKLFENPSPDLTSYNLFSDISACIDSVGNAFVFKIKSQGKVVELRVIDPKRVQIRTDKSQMKVFDVMERGASSQTLGTDAIIHFRGFTIDGRLSGLSPIEVEKMALGNMLAQQEFTGRYWNMDSTPSGFIQVPGKIKRPEAEEMLAMFEERHQGLKNTGRPGLLSDGATFVQTGISSLVEAQFLETQKYQVEEIARIYDVPVELLQPSIADRAKTEEIALRYLTFAIAPRLARIETTLNADPDLFLGTELEASFETKSLLRTDLISRAEANLKDRQAGLRTVNEIRADMGYAPHPDGDTLQATPVGGAPNPGPASASASAIA